MRGWGADSNVVVMRGLWSIDGADDRQLWLRVRAATGRGATERGLAQRWSPLAGNYSIGEDNCVARYMLSVSVHDW